jgi:hypothetical protein
LYAKKKVGGYGHGHEAIWDPGCRGEDKSVIMNGEQRVLVNG